ncbi:hypothetical protein AK812_SmicGene9201 [Symbiodinium microadriaticum]|uniref:RRM domain-containing protein n=1 Tax=Symbiodinium microadriaticum TaxID=2951 RepID=A0A1Q9EJ12_SYMMI|nr:hypothetical protein AK812_SmicGene9201 [Symbiodinium microadriaticum]
MLESQSFSDMADRGPGPTFRSSATSPVLYLRGLPWGATAEAVQDFLSPIRVKEVIIVNSQEDGPTGEVLPILPEASALAGSELRRLEGALRKVLLGLPFADGRCAVILPLTPATVLVSEMSRGKASTLLLVAFL